jgi:ABC-type Fe3+ transport system permease subunit
MARSTSNHWRRTRRRDRPRRFSRPVGCLFWVLAFLVILLLLSLIFGGFQKGQKAGSSSDFGQGRKPAAQELALGSVGGPRNR